jgi:hypothetical protein
MHPWQVEIDRELSYLKMWQYEIWYAQQELKKLLQRGI